MIYRLTFLKSNCKQSILESKSIKTYILKWINVLKALTARLKKQYSNEN